MHTHINKCNTFILFNLLFISEANYTVTWQFHLVPKVFTDFFPPALPDFTTHGLIPEIQTKYSQRHMCTMTDPIHSRLPKLQIQENVLKIRVMCHPSHTCYFRNFG